METPAGPDKLPAPTARPARRDATPHGRPLSLPLAHPTPHMRSFRYLLLALAFALAAPLASTAAHAQIIPKFGVAGGLNFGSLSDATAVDLDSSTGYHIGVFGDVGFGPLAARVSVLYVRAGDITLQPFDDVGDVATDASISFVAVPVDLKFRFPTPVVKPYALVGPEARFPTGDLADADARSVNLALNFGVGADFGTVVGPSLFAELRYGLDVTGFADNEFFGIPTDDSFKVNAFYVRVGVGL